MQSLFRALFLQSVIRILARPLGLALKATLPAAPAFGISSAQAAPIFSQTPTGLGVPIRRPGIRLLANKNHQGEHTMTDTRNVRLTTLLAAALLAVALMFAGPASAATITYDFSIDDGGFTALSETGAGQPWTWNATDGRWEVPQSSGGTSGQSLLAAPTVTAGSSTLALSFKHEYDFDGDAFNLSDWGRLLVSINGDPNQIAGFDVGTFTSHGYNAPSGATNQTAWHYSSGVQTSTVEFTGLTAGDELAFNWVANWDCCDVDNDPAWSITSAEIDGVAPAAPVPEPATAALLGLGALGLLARRRRLAA
mgnify:CR=1 FL=1